MTKVISPIILIFLMAGTALGERGTIKLDTGIVESRKQYELLQHIEKQIIRDVETEEEFSKSQSIDHYSYSPLNLFSSYQASYIVPPENTNYEGTPLRNHKQIQKKIKKEKEKMNIAIKEFANNIKGYNRSSGSSTWTLDLEKARKKVANDKDVTPEDRVEFLKLAFKNADNFHQNQKKHFEKLTKAHSSYISDIKSIVEEEMILAKMRVDYAKKLNKKIKEDFYRFYHDGSTFKKTALAAQLMLLRSELVVDTGTGILKELEDMISVSSLGRLIEEKIKEQKSSCIKINDKIKPAIKSAKALVCKKGNKEEECKNYQAALKDALTSTPK